MQSFQLFPYGFTQRMRDMHALNLKQFRMATDFHTHDVDTPGKALISAARPLPGKLVSLELHPWRVDADFPGVPAEFADHLKSCAALGEAGYDPLRGDAARQLEILPELLELAVEFDKPVVLHLVRPTAAVFKVLERYPLRYLVHGFRGGAAKLAAYLDRGYFVSLGTRALSDPGVAELLKTRGLERVGFETDADGTEIREVLKRAAELLELPELERVTDGTFKNFLFGDARS